MTEKNIIAYKLFCHKIFQILVYFFGENCNPPPLKKVTPLFPSKPPLKVEVLSSSPLFLKIWLEVQRLPQTERGGANYDFLQAIWSIS